MEIPRPATVGAAPNFRAPCSMLRAPIIKGAPKMREHLLYVYNMQQGLNLSALVDNFNKMVLPIQMGLYMEW